MPCSLRERIHYVAYHHYVYNTRYILECHVFLCYIFHSVIYLHNVVSASIITAMLSLYVDIMFERSLNSSNCQVPSNISCRNKYNTLLYFEGCHCSKSEQLVIGPGKKMLIQFVTISFISK